MRAIKIIISGRVQGVFFRYYTKKKAVELGIRGTVENLPGGKVKVIAIGSDETINQFIEWCHLGSPASRVDKIKIEDLPGSGNWSEFKILR